MLLDKQNHRTCLKRVCLLLALTWLSGCASNVVVKGHIPKPLIERLAINGSIRYTEEFRNYRYTETEKKRALKTLDFTDAQMTMFDQVFGSLMRVVPLTSADKQLIIEPEILEIQYTAPRETKINQYEVWIKYRIKLVDENEQKIADWIIKGYGKTPTAMLGSNSAGFNSAAIVALRDAGAQLSIGFGRQSKIKALVRNTVAPDSDVELVAQDTELVESKSETPEAEE